MSRLCLRFLSKQRLNSERICAPHNRGIRPRRSDVCLPRRGAPFLKRQRRRREPLLRERLRGGGRRGLESAQRRRPKKEAQDQRACRLQRAFNHAQPISGALLVLRLRRNDPLLSGGLFAFQNDSSDTMSQHKRRTVHAELTP